MRILSLTLMSSVAAIASLGGASAADLPMQKAAPIEYVRVCSAHGEGFFFVPGSGTCLKIGGRVRAEYRYLEPAWSTPGDGRLKDATGFRALTRLEIDARTSTGYGTLRTFFRYEIMADTGSYGRGVTPSLDKAFIQFASLTAGRAQSFFDFYANELNWSGGALGSFGSDAGTTNLLAYSATFGSGFTATVALEDRNQRNVGADIGYAVAGERLPDVVANLRIDQSWGAAQISGALHQMNSADIGAGLGGIGFGSGPLGRRVDTAYGFAVQAGVQVNLPSLAAGDQLWLQAAYAEGALSYLGVTGTTVLGPLVGPGIDGVIVNGDIKRTKGWGATAAFLHYWAPTVRQAVFGNYTSVDFAGAATFGNGAPAGLGDFKVWSVGSNVIWSPARSFDVGVELLYTKLDPRGRVLLPNGGLRSADDALEGRLRFQRDF